MEVLSQQMGGPGNGRGTSPGRSQAGGDRDGWEQRLSAPWVTDRVQGGRGDAQLAWWGQSDQAAPSLVSPAYPSLHQTLLTPIPTLGLTSVLLVGCLNHSLSGAPSSSDP